MTVTKTDRTLDLAGGSAIYQMNEYKDCVANTSSPPFDLDGQFGPREQRPRAIPDESRTLQRAVQVEPRENVFAFVARAVFSVDAQGAIR